VAALRSLAVVNALGQAVLTRTHDGAETVVVPTGTLPAGLYLLRLTDTEGGVHTLRFAKPGGGAGGVGIKRGGGFCPPPFCLAAPATFA